jgi:polysaccharide deacetylase family protein (PEP-CTERM system associated)
MRCNSQLHSAPLIGHVLSVDVEDYFQVEAFAEVIARRDWDQCSTRVVANTERILDLLQQHDTRATFFFLGWVADRFPALVRKVTAAGHEVACHSYWHRQVCGMTPAQFRADTRQAKDAIEQAAGAPVVGYRAPTWSITKQCLWALDILAELGFCYDSSIFPIHHDLYGIPGGQRFAYVHRCGNGLDLAEIPPTTIRMFGTNFPAAGGGYLRICPLSYTQWAFRQAERDGQSVIVYFHPWEIDAAQPRVRAKLRSRFRHYTNLHKTEARLLQLLRTYHFQPMAELLRIQVTSPSPLRLTEAVLLPFERA